MLDFPMKRGLTVMERRLKITGKAKRIGYRVPQYYECESIAESPDYDKFKKIFDYYAKKAKTVKQPNWYEKYACLYFMYDEKAYCIYPDLISASPEIFGVLADKMIDEMYEVGAYEMFYGGMLD